MRSERGSAAVCSLHVCDLNSLICVNIFHVHEALHRLLTFPFQGRSIWATTVRDHECGMVSEGDQKWGWHEPKVTKFKT